MIGHGLCVARIGRELVSVKLRMGKCKRLLLLVDWMLKSL